MGTTKVLCYKKYLLVTLRHWPFGWIRSREIRLEAISSSCTGLWHFRFIFRLRSYYFNPIFARPRTNSLKTKKKDRPRKKKLKKSWKPDRILIHDSGFITISRIMNQVLCHMQHKAMIINRFKHNFFKSTVLWT